MSKCNFQVEEGNQMRKNQFVYVGRLEQSKGIKILIKAWHDICDSELLLCGIGSLTEWCYQYINNNNLANIKMMGFISGVKVMEIIAESKAIILPTQLYEGFPMVIVEAFSVGTPVIGSNIGNVGSIIEHGITGMHFQYGSVQNLQEVILSMQMESESMTENILDIYKEKYSPEVNYRILSNIYGSLG